MWPRAGNQPIHNQTQGEESPEVVQEFRPEDRGYPGSSASQAARQDQTWPRRAQCSAGALPSCSAWLTGAGTGPVTIRIQSSWCSCSVHTKSQGRPILRMGKLRGREWSPVQSKDSIAEPGCPTHRPAVPGGQTGAGSADSTVHGLGPQGGLEASLCLVQGLLTTPFQP